MRMTNDLLVYNFSSVQWKYISNPPRLTYLKVLKTRIPFYYTYTHIIYTTRTISGHWLALINYRSFLIKPNPFQEFYPEGHYIIKQDTLGDKFYILSEGQVKVTKTNKGKYNAYLTINWRASRRNNNNGGVKTILNIFYVSDNDFRCSRISFTPNHKKCKYVKYIMSMMFGDFLPFHEQC